MGDFSGVVEYVTERKSNVSANASKMIVSTLYAAAALICFLFVVITGVYAVSAFLAAGLGLLIWFTWPMTSVFYEYSIFAGTLTVARIAGNRFRKVLLKIEIKNIVSLTPGAWPDVSSRVSRRIAAVSSLSHPDVCAALFEEAGSRKGTGLLLLECGERVRKALEFHNRKLALGRYGKY